MCQSDPSAVHVEAFSGSRRETDCSFEVPARGSVIAHGHFQKAEAEEVDGPAGDAAHLGANLLRS